MDLVHQHLIITGRARHPVTGIIAAQRLLERLAESLHMRTILGPFAAKGKEGYAGISAVSVIEFSNIALHTWVDESPALIQLDVYSCKPFDPQQVFRVINFMDFEWFDTIILNRTNGIRVYEL
jgi:S-adenosylmethionine/arginine decarboxylase-like enzyme